MVNALLATATSQSAAFGSDSMELIQAGGDFGKR
jgi:hypothetical protein